MFLHTIGHIVKNRLVRTNFSRSSETVSRYFNKVLHTNLVLEGNKTSTGFKKVHLNGCAKALNIDQISNHLKTLKKKVIKNQLRNLSGDFRDEDQFILSFDHEHYTNYFEVNMWMHLYI
jgi:hypothetical protein